MKNNIAVYINIDDCINAMNNVITNFEALETKFVEITEKINDQTNWKGEVQDKSSSIQKLLNEYETSLKPMCEELKKDIIELRDSSDTFDSNSYNVSKLKAW
ncbi:hypothetical protein [Anaerosporobacter sp.]